MKNFDAIYRNKNDGETIKSGKIKCEDTKIVSTDGLNIFAVSLVAPDDFTVQFCKACPDDCVLQIVGFNPSNYLVDIK